MKTEAVSDLSLTDALPDLVPANMADIKTEPDDNVPESTPALAPPSFTVMDAYDWALQCHNTPTRVYLDYADPYGVHGNPFCPCLGPEDQPMSHPTGWAYDEWDERLPQSHAVPISHFWTH